MPIHKSYATRLAIFERALKSGEYKSLILDICPKLSRKLLERNSNNRDLSKSRVTYYANEHSAGRWVDKSGQPIIFDLNGELVTGQHRLAMIDVIGTTLHDVLVVVGADENAKIVNDTGKAKTPDDILKIAGYRHLEGNKVAKPGGIIKQVISGMTGGRGIISPYEMLEHAKSLVRGLEFAYKAFAKNSKLCPVARAPIVAVAVRAYYSRPKDRDKILEFFDVLCSGVARDLSQEPIILLRDHIHQSSARNSKEVSAEYRLTEAYLYSFLEGSITQSIRMMPEEVFVIPWLDDKATNQDGENHFFINIKSTGLDAESLKVALGVGSIRLSCMEKIVKMLKPGSMIAVGSSCAGIIGKAVVKSGCMKKSRTSGDKHPYVLEVSGGVIEGAKIKDVLKKMDASNRFQNVYAFQKESRRITKDDFQRLVGETTA